MAQLYSDQLKNKSDWSFSGWICKNSDLTSQRSAEFYIYNKSPTTSQTEWLHRGRIRPQFPVLFIFFCTQHKTSFLMSTSAILLTKQSTCFRIIVHRGCRVFSPSPSGPSQRKLLNYCLIWISKLYLTSCARPASSLTPESKRWLVCRICFCFSPLLLGSGIPPTFVTVHLTWRGAKVTGQWRGSVRRFCRMGTGVCVCL